MGADPTTSRVTGECSTVELQPHNSFENQRNVAFLGYFFNHSYKILRVPESGVEPLFRAYESLVLTVELHRQVEGK